MAHQPADEPIRQAMASPQGWPLILDRYAATSADKLEPQLASVAERQTRRV